MAHSFPAAGENAGEKTPSQLAIHHRKACLLQASKSQLEERFCSCKKASPLLVQEIPGVLQVQHDTVNQAVFIHLELAVVMLHIGADFRISHTG